MKPDERIKALSDILTCFDIERAKEFIGQKGYFAGDLYWFNDLPSCPYGTLTKVSDNTDNTSDIFQREDREEELYPYFIPESSLKPVEKACRPFTLSEFSDKFTVGQPIKFREKGAAEDELYFILLGYRSSLYDGKTIPYIYIGYLTFTLDELFNDYEWQETDTGDWKLFGVEE